MGRMRRWALAALLALVLLSGCNERSKMVRDAERNTAQMQEAGHVDSR